MVLATGLLVPTTLGTSTTKCTPSTSIVHGYYNVAYPRIAIQQLLVVMKYNYLQRQKYCSLTIVGKTFKINDTMCCEGSALARNKINK
jgi:hypothetical protein